MKVLPLFLMMFAALNAVMAADPSVARGAGVGAVTIAFDQFKALIGGEDNENDAGPIEGGFRTIDWDAAGVPFDMPGNFFRDTVTRGIFFTVDGDEFRVSNPIMETDPGFGDNLFDTFNPDNPNQFQAFSEARIFSPLTDYTFIEEFSTPGSPNNDPALISAYGAIFVDVDNENETSIEFFDMAGESLGKYFVPASPDELSFLGVDFGEAIVAKVEVNLGNALLGTDDIPKDQDVVVMDDFVFSEPVPIKKSEGRKYGP